jgi:hypothetical protein
MAMLKFLSAALVAAAMLAAPAMARESDVTSRHLVEDAKAITTPGARHIVGGDGYGGYGTSGRQVESRGYRGRDVWGHWGSYYGPMVPTI